MNLLLHMSEFKGVTINSIDVTSFSYNGSTSDYDYNAHQSFNTISFRLLDSSKTEEVFEDLKSKFNLNLYYVKIEDYLRLRTTFEDYESDKRAKITISFRDGSRGISNPPSFNFTT